MYLFWGRHEPFASATRWFLVVWITVNWRKEGKPQSTPGGYEVAVEVGIVKKKRWINYLRVAVFIACENSRFFSLLAAGDVSRGGTSATRRQIFHTYDVNLSGIQSLALIGQRSSYIVLAIVYEWQTKDKRLQRWNVNAMNLKQNSQYLWNIFFSRRSIWVLLELLRSWTQHFTKIDQEKRFINVNIDSRHKYGIYVAESQTFLLAKRPQRRGASRNGCFRRLRFFKNKNLKSNDAFALYEQELAQSVGARSSVRAVPVRFPGVTSNPCFDFCPFSVALESFKKMPVKRSTDGERRIKWICSRP